MTRRRTRSAIIFAGELVVAFAVWRQVTGSGPAYRLTSDLGRYFTIVTQRGTPYRDFAVEYPPGALALFWLLGRSSFDAFVHHMLLVNFACQAVVAAICFRGWGSRAGWSYVLLSTPLLVIVYSRYDLIVLAIAQMGVHLVFFIHITTDPDNTNNILALAFGLLIVFLVVGGSLWIMSHLNHNMMPMDQIMQMQR